MSKLDMRWLARHVLGTRMGTADASLRGQLLDSRYLVEGCIGRGGMGVVWRVRHAQTRQQFALKTILGSMPQNKKVIRRLLHEARATAAVRSRHVVRVIDVEPDYVHAGVHLPYLVMELLEGENLSQFLGRTGTIGPSQLVWVMRQVSQALAQAHARGIVHRDLKPSNVLLAREDDGMVVVKVCDFGIAKLQGAAVANLAETGTLSTATGEILGTPRYMAPEQLRRAANEGPKTDQWAFALIAFRALTGRNYFEGATNVAELVLAIVHEVLPVPSSLSARFPTSLDAWFARSCARDPHARFSSIEEQQAELERCLDAEPPTPIRVEELLPNCPVEQRRGTGSPGEPSNTDLRTSSWHPRAWQRLVFYLALGGAAASAFAGARWGARYLAAQSKVSGNHGAHELGSGDAPQPSSPIGLSAYEFVSYQTTVPASTPVTTSAPLAISAKPAVSGIQRPIPKDRRNPFLLPHGRPCTRSSQCKSGMCAAEICQ